MSWKKRTKWLPVSAPPERVGVYERVTGDGTGVWFQCWNGRWWGAISSSPGYADRNRARMSGYQCGEWRGLAEDPSKKP